MKILVVEDELRLAEALSQIMQEQKYQVDVANDGNDGLDYALYGDYDVIVLDVMLPGKDGFEVVRALRAAKVQTPVIMLTARDTSSIIKLRGLNTGVLERTPDGQPLTSCNLGRLVIDGGRVQACILGRHATETGKELLLSRIRKTVSEASARITAEECYPEWEPDSGSPLARIMTATYRDLAGKEPRITVIHAGLECGLLKNLRPELDIVSVGPDVFGAHTPEERVGIASVKTCYDWILKTLEKLSEGKEIPAEDTPAA